MAQKLISPNAQKWETYSQGTLERDIVLLDTADGFVGNGGLAVLENGSNIDGLPLDWGLWWGLVC